MQVIIVLTAVLAGAGTGNAGPGGVSASRVAISSATNGRSSVASGTGAENLNFLTGQAAATAELAVDLALGNNTIKNDRSCVLHVTFSLRLK